MKILSIDIGQLTLSMWLEEFDFEGIRSDISNLKKKVKEERINREILKGQVIDISIKNLTEDNIDLHLSLFKYLDSKKEIIDMSDEITIEDQFFMPGKSKDSGTNIKCIKLMENIRSYFVLLYPQKVTSITPSRMKSQFLVDLLTKEEMKKKKKRKEASIKKARMILEERKDLESLEFFESLEKKDDVSDALLLNLARKKKLLQQRDKIPKGTKVSSH
jgi:hypothetical protein